MDRERKKMSAASTRTIKVCIVEDEVGFRAGLIRLLERTPDFQCLGAYATAEAGIKAIPALKPDVVLMDLNLPGMNGVECVRQLNVLLPSVPVVMLTVYEDSNQIYKALSAGAMGYLLKQTPPAELLDAVRDVCSGGAPMSSQIARKVVQSFQNHPAPEGTEGLSPREREVLDYLVEGYLIKEIGQRLGISFETVRTHIGRIYEKLHVHSRAQAVARFVQTPRRPEN